MRIRIINTFYFFLSVITILMWTVGCKNSESFIIKHETGSFTDSRDGKKYKTVKIGDQWIMAENLAFRPEKGKYWAYQNDSDNVSRYGYLYDWETANQIAPDGWHLPSKSEWKTLRKSLGGKMEVWKSMEKVYIQMVVGGGSGFDALFGGMLTCEGKFMFLGEETAFWSSTKTNDGIWYYGLESNKDSIPYGLTGRNGSTAYANGYGCPESGKSVRVFKN